MQKLCWSLLVLAMVTGCRDTKKNEEVKEDIKDRLEKVGEKIDTGLDKVREKLKVVGDTVKSKIHRATAPDSQK